MNEELGRLRRHYDLRGALDAVRSAREGHPDDRALFSLHADLLAAQCDADCGAAMPGDARPSGAHSLGPPWLRSQGIGFDPVLFPRLASKIAVALAPHREEWNGQTLRADPSDVLSLAREALEEGKAATDLEPNLLGASAEGALQACLNPLAERVGPSLDLENWRRPVCPFCGSHPILAAIEPELGERHLYCHRCGTMWPYRRTSCINCAQDDRAFYRGTSDPAYRLYKCPDCGSYLKTIDLRCLPRPFHPVVEGLLTIGLDVVAAEAAH